MTNIKGPELPVILCTGYSEQIDETMARSVGIRGYVNKPIATDEFLGLVAGLLQVVLSENRCRQTI
jgi:CheY-like chemotaxis protein